MFNYTNIDHQPYCTFFFIIVSLMALVKNVMVLLSFLALIEVSFGVVYEVGDSRGWTNDSNFDYKSWASTKEFRVGDTIRKLFLSLFLFIIVFNIRLYLLNDWLYWRIVFSFSLDLHLIIIGGKKTKHQIKGKKNTIYITYLEGEDEKYENWIK